MLMEVSSLAGLRSSCGGDPCYCGLCGGHGALFCTGISIWLQRWTVHPMWPSSRVTGRMILATQGALNPSTGTTCCESCRTTRNTYRLATTLTLTHYFSICGRFVGSLGIDNNLKDVKQNRMWEGTLRKSTANWLS